MMRLMLSIRGSQVSRRLVQSANVLPFGYAFFGCVSHARRS
jgi:hypothetical protein